MQLHDKHGQQVTTLEGSNPWLTLTLDYKPGVLTNWPQHHIAVSLIIYKQQKNCETSNRDRISLRQSLLSSLISARSRKWKFKCIDGHSIETLRCICWLQKYVKSPITKSFVHNNVILVVLLTFNIIIHFRPMLPFNTPWKHQKTRGFRMFSGSIKKEH